ncbi:hypothetical protein Trydic_g7122 [Trypoxylus dichotomus]
MERNYFKKQKHKGDVLTIVSQVTGIYRVRISRIVDSRASTTYATPKHIMSKPCVKSTVDNCEEEEKSSFRRLLLKTGFRWKKTTDNRKVLMEKVTYGS